MPPALVSNTPLSSVEMRKLRIYLAETNTTDSLAAIDVLTECGWDLQKSVEKYVLDLTMPPPAVPEAPEEEEEDSDVEIVDVSDDSDQEDGHEIDIDEFEMDVEESRPASQTSGFFPKEHEITVVALQKFQENFNKKFPSQNPPPFFMEDLQKAVSTDRPLLLFVTNEKSIAQNIFCEQVLLNDAVMSVIRENFVLYPWDVTSEEYASDLMEDLRITQLDNVAHLLSMMLANQVEGFPVLLPVIKKNRGFETSSYCESSDTADAAYAKLQGALETQKSYNRKFEAIRREQEERLQIRRLQEQEYEASLAADKAKIEKKRKEEEEKKKALEEEERKRMEELERRDKMKRELPMEPDANEQGVLVVKFRLPEGKQMMRRFRPTETIQILADFLSSNGFPSDTFKYFNSDFPKKNVIQKFENFMNSTFADVKWPAREQIFVEEI